MKLLNRLTIKHLLMNKKRTIVTIISILLSTSLMVGIGLLLSTFLNALRIDATEYNGIHHAYFSNLSYEQKDTLDYNINFEKTYSYGVVGFAPINSSNSYKPYLFVVSADNDYFESETLVEGRLPENSNEIVLSSHLKSNGEVDFKVGDEITLDIGARVVDGEEVYDNNVSFVKEYDRDGNLVYSESFSKKKAKTYKVVGIVKRSHVEDYSSPGYMAFTVDELDVISYRTYVLYKKISKTYDLTSEICSSLSKNVSCNTNDTLLYYYGVSRYDNVNSTIISILIISLTLLSVGCIIVIYNSFAISTMERKKSFGLYSSLGASPKQIKYTVFFEAFLVGTIGIILGIIAAFLGIYATVLVLSHLLGDSMGITLVFTVQPSLVLIPVIFMILVVYLSAFIPAKRSSHVSSIELIRENDEIKIPRRKVKTPKLIRKLFGMEGEIALKNMKRNKRKYRITLLSLFISIVLFISFGTYVKLGLNITDFTDNTMYDIYVSADDKDILNEISLLNEVDEAYFMTSTFLYMKPFDASYYHKDYYKYYFSAIEDDILIRNVIAILPDDDFERLSREAKVSSDKAIFLNQLRYTVYGDSSRKSYQTEVIVRDFSSVELCMEDDINKNESSYKCENLDVAVVNKIPDFVQYLPVSLDSPIIFFSESMALQNSIVNHEDNIRVNYLTLVSKEYKKLDEIISKKYENTNDLDYYSPRIELEEAKNAMLAVKILLYGFITLVTLIGVTSVFNTIYTSIHLRRKEFAMLRSVGMSIKGFNRMIFFESLFFGLKSLFFALPVSFGVVYLINISIGSTYDFGYLVIPWGSIIEAILGVFIIVLLTMWYSVSKIKKENILSSLRDDNI